MPRERRIILKRKTLLMILSNTNVNCNANQHVCIKKTGGKWQVDRSRNG